MKIKEARELLDFLENLDPNVDLRVVVNNPELLSAIRKEYLTALEQTAFSNAEVNISRKLIPT